MESETQAVAGIEQLRGIVQESLARNLHVLGRHADGLSHADSLLQPQPRGNCFNWVVGHMAETQESMLAVVGGEPVFLAERIARYARGSAPVVEDGVDVIPFADLLAGFATQQERIEARLAAMTPEALSQPSRMPGMNLIELLQFLAWHETYHLGQLDQLRQLSGVNDTVIP